MIDQEVIEILREMTSKARSDAEQDVANPGTPAQVKIVVDAIKEGSLSERMAIWGAVQTNLHFLFQVHPYIEDLMVQTSRATHALKDNEEDGKEAWEGFRLEFQKLQAAIRLPERSSEDE